MTKSFLARMREISSDKQQCPNHKQNTFALVLTMRKRQRKLLIRKQYENKGNAKLII